MRRCISEAADSTIRDLALAAIGGDHESYLVLMDVLEERDGESQRKFVFEQRLVNLLREAGARVTPMRKIIEAFDLPGVFERLWYSEGWVSVTFPDGDRAHFEPENRERGQVRITSRNLKDGWVLKNSEVVVPNDDEDDDGYDGEFEHGDEDNDEEEPPRHDYDDYLEYRMDKKHIVLLVSQDGDPESVRYSRYYASWPQWQVPTPALIKKALLVPDEYRRVLSRGIEFFENLKRGLGSD